jgi:hypothetical protein
MTSEDEEVTTTPEDALAAIPGAAGYLIRRLARQAETPSTPGILHLRLLVAGLTYLVARDLSPLLASLL